MTGLCPHFPSCGGCTFQHLSYEQQLKEKQAVVEGLFPGCVVSPIIPCTDIWHYRNKMEFSFSQNKAGDRFLGLILKQSRGKVFNLQECLIAPEGFAQVLGRVRSWWEKTGLGAFHFRSGTGVLRTLTLRQGYGTGEKMAILTVSTDPRFPMKQSHLDGFVEALEDSFTSIFLQGKQTIAGQPTQFFEMHLKGKSYLHEVLCVEGRRFEFKMSPSSFFQPNTKQAEVLYETALSFPQLDKSSRVYDLYCGTGTLGIVCAPRAGHVIGVEINPYAVFDAKINSELNEISNISFEQLDVGKMVMTPCNLVILDPPRAGLDRTALQMLNRLKPAQILYISCNPKTQAVNIKELSDYRVVKIQPMDQFPHTPHIENIVYLQYSKVI